jgi:uncharacterized RDD family membrane protein YckC
MPQQGPGSIARAGRRLVALLIDYLCAVMITIAFFPPLDRGAGVEPIPFLDFNPSIVMAIFAVVQILFIPTLGGSPGHRVMGMRLIRADGAWTGLWRPIVRTILLVLVIPAVIWDADQRGLHDKAAGTILVCTR